MVACSLLGCATPAKLVRYDLPRDAQGICATLVRKVLDDFHHDHKVTEWDLGTSRQFLGEMIQNEHIPILGSTWAIMISARRLTLRLQSAQSNEDIDETIVDIHQSCVRGVRGHPRALHNDLSTDRYVHHL